MTTATVETLTAEVRVLMVGNRQVTLSVYRQLDYVYPQWIDPFGRVNANSDRNFVQLVGSYKGVLVRSEFERIGSTPGYRQPDHWDIDRLKIYEARRSEWESLKPHLLALPLIVLAGLK